MKKFSIYGCQELYNTEWRTCPHCRRDNRERASKNRDGLKQQIKEICYEYEHEEGCHQILNLIENRYKYG